MYEVEVRTGSPLVGVSLQELGTAGLLRGALVAAIDREDFVRVPGAADCLKAGDVAVVLAQADAAEGVLEKFTAG